MTRCAHLYFRRVQTGCLSDWCNGLFKWSPAPLCSYLTDLLNYVLTASWQTRHFHLRASVSILTFSNLRWWCSPTDVEPRIIQVRPILPTESKSILTDCNDPSCLTAVFAFSTFLVRVGVAGVFKPCLGLCCRQVPQLQPAAPSRQISCLSSLDVDVTLVGLEEMYKKFTPQFWQKIWTVALKHPKLVKCCDLPQDQQRFIALCDSCSAPSGSLWESGFADSDIMNSTKSLVPIHNIHFLLGFQF